MHYLTLMNMNEITNFGLRAFFGRVLATLVMAAAFTVVVPTVVYADGNEDWGSWYTPTYSDDWGSWNDTSYSDDWGSWYTPSYSDDWGSWYTPTYSDTVTYTYDGYYDYNGYYDYDGYYEYNGYYDYEPYYSSYEYSYSEPYYYSQPYVSYNPGYSYGDYYYVYDDYYYYRDYDRPRRDYDRPSCVIEVSDKTPEEGDYVTVSWEADDADYATLSGFGSVSPNRGSERVRATDDRTFTLRVEGRGGSESCSISIRVEEEREHRDTLWCELDASDTSIEEGDSVTLEWDTRGDVRDARINQGIGSVDEDGGTERVRPNRTTTYRLTIEDRHGREEDCSVTVRVDEDDSLPPPPDVPLVYLSQLPYTGAGDGPMYWILLIVGGGLMGYMLLFRALPFAYARVKMLNSETPASEEGAVGEGEEVPQNVTRQDVRAFVSAIAEGDAASAREFAKTGGEVLFAEAAVILDDVVRSRENGSAADPMVKEMTKGWDAGKFAALIEALADAKDESVVEKALG